MISHETPAVCHRCRAAVRPDGEDPDPPANDAVRALALHGLALPPFSARRARTRTHDGIAQRPIGRSIVRHLLELDSPTIALAALPASSAALTNAMRHRPEQGSSRPTGARVTAASPPGPRTRLVAPSYLRPIGKCWDVLRTRSRDHHLPAEGEKHDVAGLLGRHFCADALDIEVGDRARTFRHHDDRSWRDRWSPLLSAISHRASAGDRQSPCRKPRGTKDASPFWSRGVGRRPSRRRPDRQAAPVGKSPALIWVARPLSPLNRKGPSTLTI